MQTKFKIVKIVKCEGKRTSLIAWPDLLNSWRGTLSCKVTGSLAMLVVSLASAVI